MIPGTLRLLSCPDTSDGIFGYVLRVFNCEDGEIDSESVIFTLESAERVRAGRHVDLELSEGWRLPAGGETPPGGRLGGNAGGHWKHTAAYLERFSPFISNMKSCAGTGDGVVIIALPAAGRNVQDANGSVSLQLNVTLDA